jgi:aminoglycoside 2''-phosphotransferase
MTPVATTDQAKTEIENNFPDLQISSIEVAGEGMDSKAFVVNSDYIFRFPKFKWSGGQLGIEIKLLPELKKYVTLNIPNFEFIGKQESSLPFVGYKKIHGVALDEEYISKMNEDELNNLVKQISHFLNEIHSFPVDKAVKAGVEVDDFKKSYEGDLERMRNEIYKDLDEKTQGYVEKIFNEYLSNNLNFSYKPQLLHADLSPEHIIYNAEKKTIEGIIDFGDVNVGDPDYDLMYLYEGLGIDFLNQLLKFYKRDDRSDLMTKLKFFRACNTVHDILIGTDSKDQSMIDKYTTRLKQQALKN